MALYFVPNRATFEYSQPISSRTLLYCCSCIRQQTSLATNAAIAAQIMARVLVLEETTGLFIYIHTRHTLVAKHLFPTLSIHVSVRPLDMIPVSEVQIPSNM